MQIEQVYQVLARQIDQSRLQMNAPMREYTSFRAGGEAALLITPKTIEEVQAVIHLLAHSETDYMVMGNGSNLLVLDTGYEGAIVKIGSDLARIEITGNQVKAEAGALLKEVSNQALHHHLSGFEFASGIPGSIGGAAFMNAGAYGGEMSQVVEDLLVLKRDGSELYRVSGEEMQYGYRQSLLMDRGDFILTVTLKLQPGEFDTITTTIEELTRRRTQKQPLQYPSAGSFFKRPKGHYAGQLIEESNLKGLAVGGARISPLHAGFLINENNATATDIINLMKLVQTTVYDRTGVMLEPEVRIIGKQEIQ